MLSNYLQVKIRHTSILIRRGFNFPLPAASPHRAIFAPGSPREPCEAEHDNHAAGIT